MPKFSVTYDTLTPESAKRGDYEESGYVCRDVDLRTAYEAIGRVAYEDAGTWFINHEYGHYTRDYFKYGREESRSLHPPRNITGASYNRLRRLLGVLN